MNTYARLWLVVCVCLGIILVDGQSPHRASACSNGSDSSPSLDWLIENSQYAVMGEIIETDAIQQDAIIHVESYVYGQPQAEFLTVQQTYHHEYQEQMVNGHYACILFDDKLEVGYKGVFFIIRMENSFYFVIDAYLFPNAHFKWYAPYYTEDNTKIDTKVNLAELVALLGDITGETPAPPEPNRPKSLHAPLLIQTSTNMTYMLPADLSTPMLLGKDIQAIKTSGQNVMIGYRDQLELQVRRHWSRSQEPQVYAVEDAYCFAESCFDIAGAGTYFAYQNSSTQFKVCMVDIDVRDDLLFCPYPIQVQGESLQFSPTGDYFIVLDRASLKIYLSDTFDEKLIRNLPLKTEGISSKKLFEHVVWSSNGEKLVYSDAEGLWILNRVMGDDEPSLLVNGENVFAQYFSPLGNFLSVNEDGTAYTLDLLTGQHLPDGLVSPDERALAIDRFEYVCDLTNLPCRTDYATSIEDVVWTNHGDLLGDNCPYIYPPGCGLYLYPPSFNHIHMTFVDAWILADYQQLKNPEEIPAPPLWYVGDTFVYDPIGDNVAILNDGHTISFTYSTADPVNIFLYHDYLTLDFSEEISGEIIHIEWLSSAFYQGTTHNFERDNP